MVDNSTIVLSNILDKKFLDNRILYRMIKMFTPSILSDTLDVLDISTFVLHLFLEN